MFCICNAEILTKIMKWDWPNIVVAGASIVTGYFAYIIHKDNRLKQFDRDFLIAENFYKEYRNKSCEVDFLQMLMERQVSFSSAYAAFKAQWLMHAIKVSPLIFRRNWLEAEETLEEQRKKQNQKLKPYFDKDVKKEENKP